MLLAPLPIAIAFLAPFVLAMPKINGKAIIDLFTPVPIAVAFLAPFVLAAPNPKTRAIVNLRVEGEYRTIFEGTVYAEAHNVTTAMGGEHHCDGTNYGANPLPGPTATSALDIAARGHGFEWDGFFCTEYDDYFITSIGGQSESVNQFWALLINYRIATVGGCQAQVKDFDEVVSAFDGFSKRHFLKLSGPQLIRIGQSVTLTVTDGKTGEPVEGAVVKGKKSDAQGNVSVMFTAAGVQTIKAEKEDSVRSNGLEIDVKPSGGSVIVPQVVMMTEECVST